MKIKTWQNQIRLLTKYSLFYLLIPMFTFASVLSDLAATLAPGEMAELGIDGTISNCEAMVPPLPLFDNDGNPIPSREYLGNIFQFTDEAQWYPANREIYIMGTRRPYKRWDQGFIKYSEATNSWTLIDLPPFGVGAHGYDNAAMDVVRGHYYWSRIGNARIVWQMDLTTGIWTELPYAPINAGQFSAIEYYPEIDRLVFFDGLNTSEYALFNPETNLWEGPIDLSMTPFGAISHFSEYNPNYGILYYGGGFHYTAGGTLPDPTPNIDESRRFYMMDGNKTVTRLADSPTKLGQFGAGPIQTIDPISGNLVVFQGQPNDGSNPCPNPLPIWEYNLDTDTWGQTGTHQLMSYWCSLDTVAVPLYDYGVTFIASVRSDTDCRVHLYRHSPMEPTPPSIITQPVSQSAEEGSTITFSMTVNGSVPLQYQWYRNDVLIADAREANLAIDPIEMQDDGAQYHCSVSNNLGNTVSDYAILSVIQDFTAPLINTASVRSPSLVDIQFSESISTSTAQTLVNYQISAGIQVIAANLSADGKTVQLQTDDLTEDTVYTITINNIQDISVAANKILDNSTIEIMFAPIMNFDDGLLPLDWIPLTLSRWSIVSDNSNNALFLNTTNYDSLPGSRLGEYLLSPDSYVDFTLSVKAKTNEPSGNANADYALVFGFQDANNYYYMMFNRIMTNTQLFKVVNGSRRLLATATSNWLTDNNYHTVEVTRASAAIEIRFDNVIVLQTTDSLFSTGQIGLGSFNDSAYFDDIRITTGANSMNDLVFFNSFE